MGGGDLNLKKSWHPSTFHNLEKVWKAEQRHETEQKKIEQLQQELREERAREEMQRMAMEVGATRKREERVDWLYMGPSTVNREEYLLGKKIDRLVDPTLVEEEREREALTTGPGALFASSDGASSSSDLAVKVREDPLFLIRKKEEDAKQLLASNPVKLKQLQQLVSKEKEGKKHKKSQKKKKKRRHSPSPEPHRSRSPQESHRHRENRTRDDSHSRLRSHQSRASRYQPYQKSHTRHMDPEELQRRREEMMASAKEHGREREQRLRRHEKQRSSEEEWSRESHAKDFLHPLRVQSVTSAQSVEERIRRNISSVQRTSAELSSNFMRK